MLIYIFFQIKDNCIRYVVKNCPRLKTIVLANCPNISDVSLLEISTYLSDIRYICTIDIIYTCHNVICNFSETCLIRTLNKLESYIS